MQSIGQKMKRLPLQAGAIGWLVGASACFWVAITLPLIAAAPKEAAAGANKRFIFYPPRPAPPRIQYLFSCGNNEDWGVRPSTFTQFLVGKEPPKTFLKPYGVAIRDNQIFVADTGARNITILDLNKKSMRYFAPSGEGRLGTPINISVDADGTRYIADTGRGQVLIFGKDESFLGAIGNKEETRPTDVKIFKDALYVVDVKKRCIRVYDKASHNLTRTFPDQAKAEITQLISPTNLALDTQGRCYVADLMGKVLCFGADGQYLRAIGNIGDSPGEFVRPKGMAVDREDRLYVVDAASQVVQVFDSAGRLLMYFGDAILNLPAGIAIDYEHNNHFQKYVAPDFKLEFLILVISQVGEEKLSVFGFGHKL